MSIKENNTMDYSNLIEYGKKIARDKIAELQYRLNLLNTLQQEIDRTNSYPNNDSKEFYMPEKYYYTMEFYEDTIYDTYYKYLDKSMKYFMEKQLVFGFDYGLIIKQTPNFIRKFVAVEINKKHCDIEKEYFILQLLIILLHNLDKHLVNLANTIQDAIEKQKYMIHFVI